LIGYFHQWGDMKPLDRWIAEFEQLLAANGGIVPAAVEPQVLSSCPGILFRRPDHPLLPGLVERATALMGTLPDGDQQFALGAFATHYLNWSGESARAKALCERILLHADQRKASVISQIYFRLILGCVMWGEAEHEAAYAALRDTLGRTLTP
jgi:hypothetical protein